MQNRCFIALGIDFWGLFDWRAVSGSSWVRASEKGGSKRRVNMGDIGGRKGGWGLV